MRENFAEALKHVLRHEGGYVNHPSDPGGETNYGITVATARMAGYRGSMRDIPMSTVHGIYLARYWNVVRCDDLPSGLDYAVFDYAVNSGVGRATKSLQKVLGVTADGRIGPETLEAIRRKGAAACISALCAERLAFLKNLRTWPVFGKGWQKRVNDVRAHALVMANRKPVSPPVSGPAGGAIAAGGGAAVAAANGAPTWVIVLFAAVAVAAIAFAVWRIKS